MPETKHPDHANHSLLTMISRCLSGQWLIDPTWLMQHADLIARVDRGDDVSHIWPKMHSSVMAVASGVYSAASGGETIGKGQALGVINLVGPVYKYGWNSSRSLIAALTAMASDDRVGGVKLIIDSPGGEVRGTRDVFQTIQKFPKPVLIVADDLIASAAYYLSAGSTKIVATQPNAQIGSIGTFSTYADWTGYYESMGLKLYEVYADDSTEKNEDSRQLIASLGKNSELAKKRTNAINDLFIADVTEGRGKRLTGKGHTPMKGRLFSPSEAIENGLIDELISDADTLELLADMVATNKQSTIQMSKFNAFLTSLGSLVTSAQNEQATEENQPTVEQLTAQLTTMTTERDGLKTQVATLTTTNQTQATKITELEAEVTRLGAQPGAMGTNPTKEKDETPKAEGEQKTSAEILKGLSFEQEATAMFGE